MTWDPQVAPKPAPSRAAPVPLGWEGSCLPPCTPQPQSPCRVGDRPLWRFQGDGWVLGSHQILNRFLQCKSSSFFFFLSDLKPLLGPKTSWDHCAHGQVTQAGLESI